jgi:hypothetical protein
MDKFWSYRLIASRSMKSFIKFADAAWHAAILSASFQTTARKSIIAAPPMTGGFWGKEYIQPAP